MYKKKVIKNSEKNIKITFKVMNYIRLTKRKYKLIFKSGSITVAMRTTV